MTIPTKLNLPSKDAKGDPLPAKDVPVDEKAKMQYDADFYEDPTNMHPGMDRYLAWKRHRVLTFMCMTSLIFWLLMASILGTLVFYRYIARRPVFIGTCVTEVIDGDNDSPFALAQSVEVDADNQVEKLRVPAFGQNAPAIFVHDFNENITLIKDIVGNTCYLKPLDRSQVAPPTSMIDLIEKMTSGYYEPRSAMIRNNYRIQYPALDDQDMEKLNSAEIASECRHSPTYWLVASAPEMTRRLRRSAAPDCKQASFGYFGGGSKVVNEVVSVCKR